MTTEPDPRVERTHRVVLAATAELLATEGLVTIDSIAERSGVARSTIYRHWPQRHQLFIEAFDHICDLAGPPDTGTLEGDLRGLAQELANGLTDQPWGQSLATLVGAAAHDDDIRAAQRHFNARRRTADRLVFERAVQRGEIDATVDLDTAVTRFVAPFFFAQLVAHTTLDATFIDDMVQATMTELAGRATGDMHTAAVDYRALPR